MKNDMRDVIMIGAGPSALSAAIYTTRDAQIPFLMVCRSNTANDGSATEAELPATATAAATSLSPHRGVATANARQPIALSA